LIADEHKAIFKNTVERIKKIEEVGGRFLATLVKTDPYDKFIQIVDTDYDKYLMLYSCQGFNEMTNSNGYTPDDVVRMENENPNINFNKTFTTVKEFHSINATILVRNLDMTLDQKNELIHEFEKCVPDIKKTDHALVHWSK